MLKLRKHDMKIRIKTLNPREESWGAGGGKDEIQAINNPGKTKQRKARKQKDI